MKQPITASVVAHTPRSARPELFGACQLVPEGRAPYGSV
jgi:hypothetical protein